MEERISIIILSSAIVIAIIFAIIFYSSWNQAQSQLQTANLNINNSASAFNSKLHNLFDQNVLLLIGSSRQSLDSSVSANASLTALQDNIKDIGNLLTPI